jgi:hypothetical protein
MRGWRLTFVVATLALFATFGAPAETINVTPAATGGGSTSPGGSSGQLQYNNAGSFGGFTLGGDCTLSQPNITCAGFAKTANNLSDLANAATARTNLGLGTAATQNIGTSGASVPLLNGNNTYSGTANFTSTFSISGQAETFPASGSLVGTTDAQTLTNKTMVAPILGVASETSFAVTGTAGAGFGEYPTQSSPPTAPATGYRAFADSTGRQSWIRASDGFVRTWDATLTASRVYTLPDATTTVVGTDVTQTVTNKTIAFASNTLTGVAPLASPTFTGTVTLPAGTANAPGLVLGSTMDGWFANGSGQFTWETGSVGKFNFISSQFRISSDATIRFGSSTDVTLGSMDTGLSRDSAGVIDVGTGAQGSKAGSINLTNLTASGYGMFGSATPLILTAGAIGYAKITPSSSAPGAAGAKEEWVCGTNSGTAKKIAYAGTSATPVTMMDNVGSGVTGC